MLMGDKYWMWNGLNYCFYLLRTEGNYRSNKDQIEIQVSIKYLWSVYWTYVKEFIAHIAVAFQYVLAGAILNYEIKQEVVGFVFSNIFPILSTKLAVFILSFVFWKYVNFAFLFTLLQFIENVDKSNTIISREKRVRMLFRSPLAITNNLESIISFWTCPWRISKKVSAMFKSFFKQDNADVFGGRLMISNILIL